MLRSKEEFWPPDVEIKGAFWPPDLFQKKVVYFESIKRELNRRLIYECRCDERLKGKVERSTHLGGYTVPWGTGTPKVSDRDEVNRREVCKYDG